MSDNPIEATNQTESKGSKGHNEYVIKRDAKTGNINGKIGKC
jgi:hypothetical protein